MDYIYYCQQFKMVTEIFAHCIIPLRTYILPVDMYRYYRYILYWYLEYNDFFKFVIQKRFVVIEIHF